MNKIKKSFTIIVIFASLFFSIFLADTVQADSLVSRLQGRILLEVEQSGEAWYLNPDDQQRYYLGRPDDTFQIMRILGLGINEENFKKFSQQGTDSLRGRILLRVEAMGEAYYVNPLDSRLYYLGRPGDAFDIMRKFGLGISKLDINLIPISQRSLTANNGVHDNQNPKLKKYTWRYNNDNYNLQFNFSDQLYTEYSQAQKLYSYYVNNPPTDIREEFYALFLKPLKNDSQTMSILGVLKNKATTLGLGADERVRFILSFIQYLEYDHEKAALKEMKPNYPFETLYLQKGVCSDFVFLGLMWLRDLGYGAAILDFPDVNHSALGIACPKEDSLASSGYCYFELTNYFPPGVVPNVSNDGKEQNIDVDLQNLFSADKLGKLEIRQSSQGRVFNLVASVKLEAKLLNEKKQKIEGLDSIVKSEKITLDLLYSQIKEKELLIQSFRSTGNITQYNESVVQYNDLLANYQQKSKKYQSMFSNYLAAVADFNDSYSKFYQQ